MCGIAGIVRMRGELPIQPGTLMRMRDRLVHRGPDGSGIKAWEGAGLASTRLAVIDLSESGAMPMGSDDGRYWIVYNGEIYNHPELRARLEKQGHRFRSTTDTEVILKLFSEQGPSMLGDLNGMFAFAIWDQLKEELFAARDRMGEKPFFYARHGGSFYFASEHKALFSGGVPVAFDRSTFDELLWFRTVAGETTPFENVRRLLPGHYLTAGESGIDVKQWYQPGTMPDIKSPSWEDFRDLLNDSVNIRRRADVKIGVLLSGGLDSSTVAAIMTEQGGPGIPSFHVRFEEKRYNESEFARMVAGANEHEHHEIVVERHQIPSLLEEATWLRGEPLAFAAGGHLLAVARYAKQHVTVLLSGEGSDEILGGYDRYRPLHTPMSLALKCRVAGLPRAPGGLRWDYLRTMGDAGKQNWIHSFNATVMPISPRKLVTTQFRREVAGEASRLRSDLVRRAMFYDQHTSLQSILDQSDRYTMGAGVECRLPFMDHRITEMAHILPNSSLFTKKVGKQVLKKAMAGRLPQPIIDRKKRPFSAPWGRFLREIPVLNAWVAALPEQEPIKSMMEPGSMRSIVDGFLAGDDTNLGVVWTLTRIGVWHETCVAQRRVF